MSYFLETVGQFVARYVVAFGVSANRRNSSIRDKHVLVVLTTPTFVVDVEQWLLARSFYFEFNNSRAPYVFSVKYVDLVTGFDVKHFMLFKPLAMVFYALYQPLGFIFLSDLALTVNKNLNCVVHDFRLLQDPLSYILAAVWAFLFTNEAFSDTLLTK